MKDLQVGNIEGEELKERLEMLQKHYLVLQKKEEYSRTTLIESQSKWTKFSIEILNIAKETTLSLEAFGQYQTYNQIGILQIKEKLQKFEAFLTSNQQELESKYGIPFNQSNILNSL